jgi:hypothetical protein
LKILIIFAKQAILELQKWLGYRIMARPHSHAMQFYRIIMLAWVVALAGCSPSPVVTITNHSPVALNNVVVSGSGFSERIESIAAGAEHRVTVRPRGESGLRVAFDAGSQHIDVDDLAYIEASGGYRVAVTVQSDLKVSASSDLGGY